MSATPFLKTIIFLVCFFGKPDLIIDLKNYQQQNSFYLLKNCVAIFFNYVYVYELIQLVIAFKLRD